MACIVVKTVNKQASINNSYKVSTIQNSKIHAKTEKLAYQLPTDITADNAKQHSRNVFRTLYKLHITAKTQDTHIAYLHPRSFGQCRISRFITRHASKLLADCSYERALNTSLQQQCKRVLRKANKPACTFFECDSIPCCRSTATGKDETSLGYDGWRDKA